MNFYSGSNFVENQISYSTTAEVSGTVDSSNGVMNINLDWDVTSYWGSPRIVPFNFAGTSCMCSGINEVHSYSSTDMNQFSLAQPIQNCVTY